MRVAVVGGGPAGLCAAETAARAGAQVTLFEAKPSVGRKLLVAGRGGLNLTNAEPLEAFIARYQGGDFWDALIPNFSPEALRAWAAQLGTETFVASTGRVYPKSLKAAPLLRAWVRRLRQLGVEFLVNHRWRALKPGRPLELVFDAGAYKADAAIFALGGGSWPQTGSDGLWTKTFEELGVSVTPLRPANCGWEVDWPKELLSQIQGAPLKNIAVSAGPRTVHGELLVTRYGLEGGAIYTLGPELRTMKEPRICLDLKPSNTVEQLVAKSQWRLSPAAEALLRHATPETDRATLAKVAKALPVALKGPRPLAEAISSAGGVRWEELDGRLMIKRLPGVFVAGEMIDWEAPTGGYLLQGCFATAAWAARSLLP